MTNKYEQIGRSICKAGTLTAIATLDKEATDREVREFNRHLAKAERVALAIAELKEMIDGGEECQGQDSRISHIIGILEGDANHLMMARKDNAEKLTA